MKSISLLAHAYVGGALRHPDEGVLQAEDDEAARLIGDGLAIDVSEDFPADAAGADEKPAGRKAAGKKE